MLALAVSAGLASAAGCSGGDAGNAGSDDAAPGTDSSPAADGSIADSTTPPRDAAGDGALDAAEDSGDAADARLDASDAGDAADAADANDGWYDIYDPAIVPTFELTLDAAALAILSNPSTLDADRKKWAHGGFKCGKITFADVGVRRKGSSTFRALPQKAAFKIRFDKYVPGQRFLGLTDLTLNNSMSDPTFIAERLAYYLFRSAGLPAEKANSAQVVINGAPWGLYLNLETPNLDFIKRVFPGKWKTEYDVGYGSQWLPGVEAGFDENVGDGTKSDVTALLAAVQAANDATLIADVSGHLDTNEWLTFSASEAATGHYDGYAFGFWGSHNYHVAGDTSGVFSLIPWSTDLTFSDRMTVVNANEPQNVGDSGPTLLGRCKLSPGCWTAYKAKVSTVLATYETLDLVNLAKTWHAQVDPLVIADPKKETPLAYYSSETALLYAWIAARPGVVRAQLGLAP